jgi:hypothetical protein
MKRQNREYTFRVLAIVLLVGLTSACREKTLTIAYDQNWSRLVPVLSPGDEIVWDGVALEHIKWIGKSPCEDAPSKNHGCTIKRGAAGRTLFSFKCLPPASCDPEIAVDDGVVVVTPTAAQRPADPPNVAIYAGCEDGKHDLVPERALRVGDVVGWRGVGEVTHASWSVTFDNQADACENNSPITSPLGSCRLRASGSFDYTFKSENTSCTPTKTTLTVNQ